MDKAQAVTLLEDAVWACLEQGMSEDEVAEEVQRAISESKEGG